MKIEKIKKIKIGGITYKVSFLKRLMESEDDNSFTDGKVNIDDQWMKFCFLKGTGKEYKEMIFFHELTHLLFYYTGTGDFNNEREVHSFASVLYQVLKDNKII